MEQQISQKQLNNMRQQALKTMNYKELGRIRVMERLLNS